MLNQTENSKYVAIDAAKNAFIQIINNRYIEILELTNAARQEFLSSEQVCETNITSFLCNEKNYGFGELKNPQSGAKGRKMVQAFIFQLVDCDSIDALLNLAINYEAKAGPTFKKVLQRAVIQCVEVTKKEGEVTPINDDIINTYAKQAAKSNVLLSFLPSNSEGRNINKAINTLFQAVKTEIKNLRSSTDHSVNGLLYKKLGNSISKPEDYDKVENEIRVVKELDKWAKGEGMLFGAFP